MKIFKFSISRQTIITILILAVFLVIYLNRAYSHIYTEIGNANLRSSDNQGTYMIKNKIVDNSKLTPIVYVALGDSLTAGVGTSKYENSYPYLLAQDLAKAGRRIILKDRAIPGERTAGLIDKLLPLAIQDKPNIVTVLIGVNDIHGNISAANFRKNYSQILDQLTKQTSAKIYAISLPYIGSDTLILPPYNYLLDIRTKEFNRIIKNLANKYSVIYLDLYTPTASLFKKSGNFYSADSFHPSAIGYKLWVNIIYDRINK